MKNTYIVIVLILLIGGFIFINKKNVLAPTIVPVVSVTPDVPVVSTTPAVDSKDLTKVPVK